MKTLVWLFVISVLCLPMGCSRGSTDQESTESGEPAYAAPSGSTDANNTARNADRNSPAETPFDQSESVSDLQISAAIRKAVMDDKALSINAHNIKIITSDGAVTLRGPVKSEQEKKTIEAKARQVAGVTQINNLLEVEKNP